MGVNVININYLTFYFLGPVTAVSHSRHPYISAPCVHKKTPNPVPTIWKRKPIFNNLFSYPPSYPDSPSQGTYLA